MDLYTIITKINVRKNYIDYNYNFNMKKTKVQRHVYLSINYVLSIYECIISCIAFEIGQTTMNSLLFNKCYNYECEQKKNML